MRRARLLALALLGLAPTLHGQACDLESIASTMPRDSLRPRMAWLYAVPRADVPVAQRQEMEFLVEEAARALRRRVAGHEDRIALAPESWINPRALLAYRATTIRIGSSAIVGLSTAPDSTQPYVHLLLDDAFAAAVPRSPTATSDDRQYPFVVGMTVSTDSTEPPPLPDGVRIAFPVFMARQLPVVPAVATEERRLEYPLTAPFLRLARVTVEFEVDEAGRVARRSIRDLYADAVKALPSDDRLIYEEFRRTVDRAILSTRFTPARIGACPVRMRVQRQFSFSVAVPWLDELPVLDPSIAVLR